MNGSCFSVWQGGFGGFGGGQGGFGGDPNDIFEEFAGCEPLVVMTPYNCDPLLIVIPATFLTFLSLLAVCTAGGVTHSVEDGPRIESYLVSRN